ncbi:MAG: methylated-DNA--[protein]-cysteine S-methyltransferase [Acidobacteriota bacterium]|nr:methylated-DNA--[protein]-cysteine S-methyltransferase [Acidobacteriota bacterium]
MASYVAHVRTRVGIFGVAGDDATIHAVYLPHEVRRATRGAAPRAVARAVDELREYFAGSRRRFSVPLAAHEATTFQSTVWATLRAIPYGEVRTYAEVAAAAGYPGAHRAVGNANHANPWPVIVPCHRVVAANGLGGYGGGDEVKRFLLALEGVTR